MNERAHITVKPDRPLLDDELEIVVRGLPAHVYVTIVSRVHEDGVRYYAYACYKSDNHGTVNVRTLPALQGGNYTGVEPMGLIWSQKQEPGQKDGRRLAKLDVTTPISTHLFVLEGLVSGTQSLDFIANDSYLAHVTCNRLHMAEGVERIEVTDGRLKGTLFIPNGSGPHPGVIDLFGTIGGTTEHRSALLASRGVASFTVCYFTPGKGDGFIADVEYFEEAIEYLLRHPKVGKPYVGIVGVSKGGELSLLISALCHQVKACVEINSIPFITLIQHSYKDEVFPACWLEMYEAAYSDEGIRFKDLYYAITPEEREEYGIPVERGHCEYLLIHGEDDQSMPPIAAEIIPKRLQKYGKNNYRVLLYADTGHLLEPPHSPHFYSTYHAMFSSIAVWGGTAKGHSLAQEDAWKEIINFFKTQLSKCNNPKNKL